jgi:hypothetical protein
VALSIIALVIAAVSLAVAIRAGRRARRRERRIVAVGCCFARSKIEGAMPMVVVRAVNLGHRPVELRALYFGTATGEVVTPSRFGDELPKVLSDGESFNANLDEFRIDEAADEAGVQLTHVVVADAEGNEYAALYPPAS